jgi:hypothetical protein
MTHCRDVRPARAYEHDSESCADESWLFNDAPRDLRVDAVEKLPELLERLKKKAESTSKKIAEKTERAKELADAMKRAASELAASRK